MKRKWLIFMTVLLGATTGCDVHEFPANVAPEPPAPSEPVRVFKLNLCHNTEMTLLGEYDYTSGGVASPASRTFGPTEARRPHDIRYTVNAYSLSRGEFSRSSDTSIIVTRNVDEGLDTSLAFSMPAGEYRFIVWTDYVDAGSTIDKYYNTEDFQEIILATRGEHYGSNPWRDAFYGDVETSVSRSPEDAAAPDTVIVGEATVNMRRPMARYTFVSTDFRRFLEMETNSRRRESTPDGAPSQAPSLDDYIVRFVYTRYMTSAFNAFTGRPTDSWTGVSFESAIRRLSDDEAEVGFDYVFVNGDRTAVTVGLEVLDRDGNLLARIPPFDVPLERSRNTIVRGEFLTTKSGGQLGINPDFNGDFNIEIK